MTDITNTRFNLVKAGLKLLELNYLRQAFDVEAS